MKRSLLILFTFLLLGLAEKSYSQEFTKRSRYTTFGITLTAANYYGDLTPGPSILSTDPKLTRMNAGIYAVRKFYPRLSGRVSLSWGRIKGDDKISTEPLAEQDAGRWQRNQSFRNDIKELAVVGMYDLTPNYGDYQKRKDYTPYVFAGIAGFYHNPKAYYDGGRMAAGWYELQPLQTEGNSYSKFQVSIPFGIGIRAKLNRQFDLGFEIGWRHTFTDYLDDVSTKYADKATLYAANGGGEKGTQAWILSDRSLDLLDKNSPDYLINGYPYRGGTSEPGFQRGDKTRNDWYILSGFTLSYNLEQKHRTPKFR